MSGQDIAGFTSNAQFWISESDGSTLTNEYYGAWSPAETYSHIAVADVNGDGLDDMVGRAGGDGSLVVALNNGDSSFTAATWGSLSTITTWTDVFVGDFNGDGMDDVLGRADSDGTLWLARSTGNSFVNSYWGKFTTITTWTDLLVGDFNGDGMDDVLGRADSDGTFWLARSTGNSFVNSYWGKFVTLVTWSDMNVGDFNGDGMDDLVARASDGTWWAAISQGNYFANSYWGKWSAAVTWSDVSVGDFNGDGLDDVAGRANNASWWINRSSGSNFFYVEYWGSWTDTVTWEDVLVGDFDRDGNDDIGGRANGQWWLAMSNGSSLVNQYWGSWPTNMTWLHASVGNFHTTQAPDTQPPTAPSNLSAVAISTSQIDLSWTAATDNVGVSEYRVERQDPGSANFVQVATTAGTTLNDAGLMAGSSYTYRVHAVDATGNLGPFSNVVSASTLAQTGDTLNDATLEFATYFGGSDYETPAGDIAKDSQGNLYMVGGTKSTDFPTTPGAIDRTFNDTSGSGDAFVTKFDASGNIIWSTYLGSTSRDSLYGIRIVTVNGTESVYIGGAAGPGMITQNAMQPNFMGGSGGINWDGYLAKLTTSGQLIWATYLGTGSTDSIRSLAVDQNGDVVVGFQVQPGVPLPSSWMGNSYQTTPLGGVDHALIKIKGDGSQVLWATYLGGSADERAEPNVAFDAQGNVRVFGGTESADMQTTSGAYDRTHNGGIDLYIATISGDGTQLLSSTYLGTSGNESGGGKRAIAVDPDGNTVISTWTTAGNFPIKNGAFSSPGPAGISHITAKLSPTGDLVASTYYGTGESVSVDDFGRVYVSGVTSSNNWPVTPNAFQQTRAGGEDGYFGILSNDLSQLLYSTYVGGGSDDSMRLTLVDGDTVYLGGQTTSGDFPLLNAPQANYAGGTDVFLMKFSLDWIP